MLLLGRSFVCKLFSATQKERPSNISIEIAVKTSSGDRPASSCREPATSLKTRRARAGGETPENALHAPTRNQHVRATTELHLPRRPASSTRHFAPLSLQKLNHTGPLQDGWSPIKHALLHYRKHTNSTSGEPMASWPRNEMTAPFAKTPTAYTDGIMCTTCVHSGSWLWPWPITRVMNELVSHRGLLCCGNSAARPRRLSI